MTQHGFDAFLTIWVMVFASLMAAFGLLGLIGTLFAPRILQWRIFRRGHVASTSRVDRITNFAVLLIVGLGMLVTKLQVGPPWSRTVLAMGMLAMCFLMARYYRWRRTP